MHAPLPHAFLPNVLKSAIRSAVFGTKAVKFFAGGKERRKQIGRFFNRQKPARAAPYIFPCAVI